MYYSELYDINYVPQECPDYPGYYTIPGFSNYLINPDDGSLLSRKRNVTRRLLWNSTHEGYRASLLIRDDGCRVTIRRHRLLQMMFDRWFIPQSGLSPIDFFTQYQVNHIDGVPGNDDLTNLEWTTPSGNVKHAHRNGKCNYMIPCKVRDIDTGEVLVFQSVISCGRYFGFSRDMILYRLAKGERHIFPERKQYRRGHSNKPWYIPKDAEVEYMKCNPRKQVVVRFLNDNTEKVYDMSRDAARDLGIAESTLSVWLDQEGQPVFLLNDRKTYIQLKYNWDTRNWRKVEDPIYEYSLNNRTFRGIFTTDDNGNKKFYPTVKDCADAHGLKNTTLNERLKIGPHYRWKDGYRYERYDPDKTNCVFSLESID